MRPAKRSFLLVGLLWPACAFGDPAATCATTSDCDETSRCVEGTCIDPFARDRLLPANGSAHGGWRFMFGGGGGYGLGIGMTDLAAVLGSGVLALLAAEAQSPFPAIAALFLPSLAGPVVHFAAGRVGPGIISFFAWTSITATTVAVAGLVALSSEFSSSGGVLAASAGTTFGVSSAALMTLLDVWMAREVHAPDLRDAVRWAPSITPARGGAIAAIHGCW